MIRALIETSLIDWDGKITTVLFFDKCNFMCPFCQNWKLITSADTFPVIEWEMVKEKLSKKQGWVDGIVLTGGEPLAHRDELLQLCERIKELGILVKIDTNGAFPGILKELVNKKLIDYVAMDIKAPLDDTYDIAAGTKVDLGSIRESITLIMKGTLDYEFRTTCVPSIIDEIAIKKIGSAIQGAKKWALQTFVPEHAYQKEYRQKLNTEYYQSLKKYLALAMQYVSRAILRGSVDTND